MTPVVSLCVPTYGRARFIGRTIESVLAQTFTDYELVVVNDNSPDDTDAVVARYDDPRLRYVKNARNLGVPENYNFTLGLGKGEFVVLLEDHDLLDPRYLEAVVDRMRSHPSAGFCSTAIEVIDESDRVTERYVHGFPPVTPGHDMLRYLLRRTDCPFTLTTFIRKSAIAGLEPWFDVRYWWYADLYLWWRLLSRFDFCYVNDPLLKFRAREEGHALDEHFWRSSLCVDQLHRENWHLVHPRVSVASLLDRTVYESAKLKTAAGARLGRKRRGQAWTEADRVACREYLPAPSRLAIEALGLLPGSFISRWRQRRSRPHIVADEARS